MNFLLAALITLGLVVSANAQSWTISAPGSYTLSNNSTSSGQFNIKITANNVDLNLNGKIVQCNAGPSTSSFGIYANSRSNVTVRNGRIVGCQFGILASYSTNTEIDGIDFTGVRYVGVSGARYVRNSIFADIAGWVPEAYAIGVNAPQTGCVIERNVFRNLHRQSGASGVGEGVGVIISSGTSSCTIRNNWFENATVGDSLDIGVWVATGANATITENSVTNFERGLISPGNSIITDNRLWLREAAVGSNGIHDLTGSVDGNVIIGYDDPISGGAAETDNLVLP